MRRFFILELSMAISLSWILFGTPQVAISGEATLSPAVQQTHEIPELVLQHGHAGTIQAMSFSMDNKLLASAGTDGTVKLWNTVTGQLLRTIVASKYWVYSVAISPNGKIVAAGSGDHIVSLWDVATGRQLGELKSHMDAVQAIAFSADGEKLVSVSKSIIEEQQAALVAVWDVRSGNRIRQIHGDGETGRKVTFVADKETIVVAVDVWDKTSHLRKNKLQVYNIETGNRIKEIESSSNIVTAFKSSRYGDLLAVVERNKVTMISVQDKALQKSAAVIPDMIIDRGIIDLAFTADGHTLVCLIPNGIDFRDVTSGELSKHMPGDFRNARPSAFSSHAERLACVTTDGSIMLTDVQSGSMRKIATGQSSAVKDVALLSDQELLAGAIDNGMVSLWSLAKGMQVKALLGHTDTVNSVSFDSKGSKCASSGNEGKIIIWDVQSEGMVDTMSVPQAMRDGYQKMKYWSRERILNKYNTAPAPPRAFGIVGSTPENPRSLSVSKYSPSEEVVALGGYEFVSLYDVGKRKLNDLTTERLPISALAFSPDGTLMVVGSETGRIDVWDMRGRRKKYSLDAHKGLINSIAFSKDKMPILATAGNDELIKIWDPLLGKPLFSLSGHSAPVTALAFGYGSASMASGSIDGTIIIADVARRKNGKVFKGHTSSINVLLYTANGRYLVSGSEDGTMTLWDANTYEKVLSMIPGRGDAWLAFSPEGFFDGTRAAWQLVPFRFLSEPLRLYEPEQFFNQFYQPGLLADIFREGKSIREILKARNDPRANLDISAYRNSKLPEVKIISPEDGLKTGKREIRITVEAKDTGSGIRDLRVFRNQTLVHFEHGDLKPNENAKTYRLPLRMKLVAGPNEISAYAFNRDNLKSKDSTITVTGADSLKRKGTAYVVAVGINQYSNTDWNLNFAVNDAKGISEMLDQSFKKLNTYAQTVTVTLVNEAATKANLSRALDLLSGVRTSIPSGAPDELKKLRRAEPEDDIIVYFSGHGMADQDRYYLIPHDMGYQGKRVDLDKRGRATKVGKAGREIIMKHSLSDQDLNKGFEKIDAGRMMLIIDACQSGQALESEEKRRGPMNSRGLAQLAYEKGMYILAAAQSFQAALEFERLGHGLLTYVLVEEGLKKLGADTGPRDGQVTAEEWLDYATQHAGREVEGARTQYAKKKGGEQIDGGEVTVTGQSPRAYYRRERVGNPWVVGRQ